MESNFKEEVKNLLKPYLSEPGNVDYLALKIEQIHERYPVSKDKED